MAIKEKIQALLPDLSTREFQYFRGIDGRVPGTKPEGEAGTDSTKARIERPSGDAQLDYRCLPSPPLFMPRPGQSIAPRSRKSGLIPHRQVSAFIHDFDFNEASREFGEVRGSLNTSHALPSSDSAL